MIEQDKKEIDYKLITEKLDDYLSNHPKKVIAIDGLDGAGKTTLGRFLACRYNISLIETDLFIKSKGESFAYDEENISRIIHKRLESVRPVIIEGIKLLELLKYLQISHDFLIYLENVNYEGSFSLAKTLRSYKEKYNPTQQADIKLQLNH
jgi:Fe-S cluster assembly ATPase SufC